MAVVDSGLTPQSAEMNEGTNIFRTIVPCSAHITCVIPRSIIPLWRVGRRVVDDRNFAIVSGWDAPGLALD